MFSPVPNGLFVAFFASSLGFLIRKAQRKHDLPRSRDAKRFSGDALHGCPDPLKRPEICIVSEFPGAFEDRSSVFSQVLLREPGWKSRMAF